jgi:hypothetical protein
MGTEEVHRTFFDTHMKPTNNRQPFLFRTPFINNQYVFSLNRVATLQLFLYNCNNRGDIMLYNCNCGIPIARVQLPYLSNTIYIII